MPAALEPWLQNAIDQFDKGAFKDGDMLSHDWIRWALQIPAASTVSDVTEIQFMVLQRFDAFRDYMLVTRKVALQSVWSKGYWIVPTRRASSCRNGRGVEADPSRAGNRRQDSDPRPHR